MANENSVPNSMVDTNNNATINGIGFPVITIVIKYNNAQRITNRKQITVDLIVILRQIQRKKRNQSPILVRLIVICA